MFTLVQYVQFDVTMARYKRMPYMHYYMWKTQSAIRIQSLTSCIMIGSLRNVLWVPIREKLFRGKG
jgi:hypothetical protein